MRSRRVSTLYLARINLQDYYCKVGKHMGPLAAATHGKELYQRAKNFVLGQPLPPMKAFWFRTARHGVLPSRLHRIEKWLSRGTLVSKILALTLLQGYRLIPHPIKVSYKGALTPSKSSYVDYNEFNFALGLLIDRFNLGRLKVKFPSGDVWAHWMGSNGPHSCPSIVGAAADALMLLQEKYRHILRLVLDLSTIVVQASIETVEFRESTEWMSGTAGVYARSYFWNPFKSISIRRQLHKRLVYYARCAAWRFKTPAALRLIESTGKAIKYSWCLAKYVFLSEGGGKTRCVTPVNYFVQCVLKPYHNYFMEVLRRLPTDYSFNEGKALEVLKRWTREGRVLSSIDMSEATDRAPRKWMKEVVRMMAGERFSEIWDGLMSIPIRFGKTRQKERSFACGAPMGIYCLWPVFTLFHHTVVQIAALRAGVAREVKGKFRLFLGYMMRGDDIVIANPAVAEEYIKLLKEFGLDYSPGKTYYKVPGVAEFAKRVFKWGQDVSPVSIKQLMAAKFLDPFCAPSLVTRLNEIYPYRKEQQVSRSDLTDFVMHTSAVRMLVQYLEYIPNYRLRSQLPERLRKEVFTDGRLERWWVEDQDNDIVDNIARHFLKELSNDVRNSAQDYLVRMGYPLFMAMKDQDEPDFPVHISIHQTLKELDFQVCTAVFKDSPQMRPSRVLDTAFQMIGKGSNRSGRNRLNNRRYRLSEYQSIRSKYFFDLYTMITANLRDSP